MKVAVVGTGYVGLVTGTCFAEIGHDVTCIDINEEKIRVLKTGKSPIYEPGLTELLERNIQKGCLHFVTTFDCVADAEVIFLAVDTPSSADGQANLDRVNRATEMVAEKMSENALVVIKSTVPVGTHEKVEAILHKNTKKVFHIVNNPEFLKEGSAVDDFLRPDRVVVGAKSEQAFKVMEELYAPLVRQGNPIYRMSNLSAEMTKYAANCFLATKISFINEIANLCDATGADIDEVRQGITSDRRIGKYFLYPGVGYGGSCFPKDVLALISTGKKFESPLKIIEAAHKVNDDQKTRLFHKLKSHFQGDLRGKVFAIWGVAFKPNTDDVREAPAYDTVNEILAAGGRVQFYDPVATPNFLKLLGPQGDNVASFESKYNCLDGAHGLLVLTEWMEFRQPDFHEIKQRLKHPLILDGRNIYTPNKVRELDIHYYSIGRK